MKDMDAAVGMYRKDRKKNVETKNIAKKNFED
jgi:hypothetical protein